MRKAITVGLMFSFLAIVVNTGHAQKANTVTCTGPLIDLSLRPIASLTVIYDIEGGHACVLTKRTGQDPQRPCSPGHTCRIEGTYSRKSDTTYVMDRITSIDAIEE
jgi:hypothetical protein